MLSSDIKRHENASGCYQTTRSRYLMKKIGVSSLAKSVKICRHQGMRPWPFQLRVARENVIKAKNMRATYSTIHKDESKVLHSNSILDTVHRSLESNQS